MGAALNNIAIGDAIEVELGVGIVKEFSTCGTNDYWDLIFGTEL